MSHLLSNTAWAVIGFILTLGPLVVIHELGHYAVARLCGVKILRFSLGFGPVLLSRRYGPDQTEWSVSAVPLGGYVKMLDEREGEVPEADLARAFNRQPLGRRAAIVVAGPLANLILAVLLFTLVGMLGVPGMRPFLDAPIAGSSAARAGVQAGDLVLALDAQPVIDWSELRVRLATGAAGGTPLELALQHQDGQRQVLILPAEHAFDHPSGDPAEGLGLRPWNPPVPARIGLLVDGGAAARQGLQVGDLIQAVDGKAIAEWLQLVERIRASPGRPLQLALLRDGRPLQLTVTPDADGSGAQPTGRIGAGLDPSVLRALQVEVRRAPLPAFVEGVRRTWDLSAMTVTMMGRMLTGTVSSKGIGGPIQIASAASETARLGVIPFLAFMALISVSLGVLNLLPVPVLDGGHLLYYSFELVIGRPLPDRVIGAGTRLGLALLVGLMALAFYNDINRYISG